jgi:hypothetical protein
MRRAGSTLQYQIAASIVEDHGLGIRVTWYRPAEHQSVISKLGREPGYKVFKSHLFTPAIGCQFKNSNAVALYSFRDLRDVVSSLQAKNRGVYRSDRLPGLVTSLLQQHELWTSQENIYVSRYEDTILDLESEIRNIGRFLGVPLDEGVVSQYGRRFSLHNQIDYIQSIPAEDLVYANENDVYDRTTLLHRNHVTDGSHGRYLRDLSPAQIEVIEELAQEWLTRYGYMQPPPPML